MVTSELCVNRGCVYLQIEQGNWTKGSKMKAGTCSVVAVVQDYSPITGKC